MELHKLVEAAKTMASNATDEGRHEHASVHDEIAKALTVLHTIEHVAPLLAPLVPGLAPALTLLKAIAPVIDTAVPVLEKALAPPDDC